MRSAGKNAKMGLIYDLNNHEIQSRSKLLRVDLNITIKDMAMIVNEVDIDIKP
jgi:hypothetical protein